MLRLRLKTLMIAIAVFAILLGTGVGLRRRMLRLQAGALEYGRAANRLETAWLNSNPQPSGQDDDLMDRAHWSDAVAKAYRFAAARPWLPLEPRPEKIRCECGFHRGRVPGSAVYHSTWR